MLQNVGYIRGKKKSLEGSKKWIACSILKRKINFDLSSFINAQITCKYYFWHLKYDKLQANMLKENDVCYLGRERESVC